MADDVVNETEPNRVTAPVRSDRGLNRVLAWVGIVAGTVFIVGAVFFSGYALGAGSGGFHRMGHGGWYPSGWNHGGGDGAPRGEMRGGCPMMGGDRDEMGGPNRMGPGPMTGPGGMMSPSAGPSPSPRS